MSKKQSDSSKKSRNSKKSKESESKPKKEKIKKLKVAYTSKPGKIKTKRKLQNFATKQSIKLNVIKSKAKNQLASFYETIVHHERQFVDGEEPPPSYSFRKGFYGLYVIFIVYSLILILAMNPVSDSTVSMVINTIIYILTFGNPFAFSNAIVAFFIVLSFIFSIDKARVFIFEEKTALKQTILYIGIIGLLYLLFLYIGTALNFMTYLLSLALIWLILLSSRFYIYSRKFSTKIEARFIKKYSRMRYFLAVIVPFLILAILVIISLFYRSFLVFLSLDFLGPSDPENAVLVYIKEMRVIMPLIYFSLIMTLIFIIFEFVSTRRRAETRRAGTFDNFTFSFIVLFIFFFQIMQISIFLLLQPETVAALKSVFGAGGSALTYIFIFEFVVSMYFLYRIIKKTGKTLGWRILFFKKDGLIMLILACVFAQTFTRFTLASNIQNQIIEGFATVLMADKYIISVLMIFFLGTTILIYYLKPHETSMFMRLQKETISEEVKSLDKIYQIVRSEYIRRGEAYPIEIIERELIKVTRLSKGNVYSLLEELAKKDMDIVIREETKGFKKPTKTIDFVSVTERFEKKGVAKQKAKQYLSQRLFETAIKKEKQTSRLVKSADSSKIESTFIASLTTDYSKKQVDKELFRQKVAEADITFSGDLTSTIINRIIQVIKKEYVYRIENLEEDPDYFIPISEISGKIEQTLKINPGKLYQILEEISKKDLELRLVENPDEPEDKKIKFLPFTDDNMNYSLANFRPDDYSEFRVLVQKNFLKQFSAKREKRVLFQLKKGIPDQTEAQRSWVELLTLLHKYYPFFVEKLKLIPDKNKLQKQIDVMIKEFEKRQVQKP